MRARPIWLHHLVTWFVALLQAKAFVPVCLILAAIIRVLWIYAIPNQQVADSVWYYNRAVAIASGQGYTIDGTPTAFWPVGYPAFLAGIFVITAPSVFVGELANVVLALGILFVSYLLAKRLFESEWIGRLTMLLLTFYPALIVFTSVLLSELLFVFLLLTAILFMQSKHLYKSREEYAKRESFYCYMMWIIAGILFGLACLTRPQAIIIPMVVCVFQIVQELYSHSKVYFKARAQACIVVSIFMVLTLVPWTIRNYELYGHIFLVSTNNGFNLFTGNSPYATGTNLEQTVIDRNIAPLVQGISTEYEADERLRSAAFAYIQAHPFATLWLWPKKVWYLYSTDIGVVKLNEIGIKPFQGAGRIALYGVKAIAQVYYVLLLAGFAIGTTLGLRHSRFSEDTAVVRLPKTIFPVLVSAASPLKQAQEKDRGRLSLSTPPDCDVALDTTLTSVIAWRTRRLPLIGIGVIGTFTAVHVVYFANDRFHFPMMPWMAMYMSALLEQWFRRFM